MDAQGVEVEKLNKMAYGGKLYSVNNTLRQNLMAGTNR